MRSLDRLFAAVPKELAAVVGIIVLVVVCSYSLILYVRNETFITISLLILLIPTLGCTYCLVIYYQSRAFERKTKSLSDLFQRSEGNSERIENLVERETEKAANMRGEDNEQHKTQ